MPPQEGPKVWGNSPPGVSPHLPHIGDSDDFDDASDDEAHIHNAADHAPSALAGGWGLWPRGEGRGCVPDEAGKEGSGSHAIDHV